MGYLLHDRSTRSVDRFIGCLIGVETLA